MTSQQIWQRAFDMQPEDGDTAYYRGVCRSFGYGVEQDLKAACAEYEAGAGLGSAKCCYGLAVLTMKEKSEEKRKKAADLFAAAFPQLLKEAVEGDAVSQRMVSCCYLFGDRGPERDMAQAKKWLLTAAENGDMDAQADLAHCYATGTAFSKDLQSARLWYQRAAQQGSKKAEKALDELGEE